MWPGDQLPGGGEAAWDHLLEAPLKVSPSALWDVAAGPIGARRAWAHSWVPRKPEHWSAGHIWSQAEPKVTQLPKVRED